MGEIFSAAGQIGAAAMQADSIKDAANTQINALERQRKFVYDNLDPSVISPQVTGADVARAQNRLRLQGQIDPALLTARYAAEAQIANQLGEFGPGSEADRVAKQAAGEAVAGTPGMQAAKDKLVDQAMQELQAGATLPPDVQAELVKAGLERSGMTTGAASPRGVGGTLLRQVIGEAGLKLKAQRQQQAENLLSSAQNLETSRQNILQSLFPKLSQQQLGNLQAKQSVLAQSQENLPAIGPTGSDIANIWLARVGATNQLAQQAADVGAQATRGLGQVWGQALGGGTAAVGGMLPSTQSAWTSVTGGNKDTGYNIWA